MPFLSFRGSSAKILSAFVFAALSLAAIACTTETKVVNADPAESLDAAPLQDEPASDASDASDASSDGGVDAAPPSREKVVVRGDLPQSCDAVCGKAKFTCAPTCMFGNSTGVLAGQATYSNKQGNFTSYEYAPIKTCAETAPATYTQFGTVYQAEYSFGAPLSCCCEAPGHYRIQGNAKAPESCADVCKAAGHTCDPNTAFSDQFGAGSNNYACPGSTLITIEDTCAAVPATTKSSGSKTCTLDSYSCGCR